MQSTEGRKYDLMVYPSVGNKLKTENYAIKPASVEKYFHLKKVIEFEITETLYDNNSTASSHEIITLAKIKNKRESINIDNKGNIAWI